MYIIKKDRVKPVFDKEIKIKMAENVVDISLRAFSIEYLKNLENEKAYNIILIDNNTKKTILNIELFDADKINNLYKKVDTILHTNFNLSLIEKIEEILKIVQQENLIENNNGNVFLNEQYKVKKQITEQQNKKVYSNSNKENNNQNNSSNKNYSKSFNEAFNEIPIVYIIETLHNMGYINIEKGPERNGDEAFYWIEVPNQSKASKVSVLSRDSLEKKRSSKILQKYTMIRDLNNGVLTTDSASNLINRLKDNGCFEDKEIFEIKKEMIQSKGGFNGFIRVNKEDQEVIGQSGEIFTVTGIDYPSRLPNIYPSKKNEEFKEYLINARKIDSDIIENEIKNKQIVTGLFADFNNYVEFGMGFFKLKYFNNEYDVSYEKFKLNKETNKLERKHLSGIQIKGRSHILKGKNPKMTIFSEAVIDSYSLYNLFRLSNKIEEENYNYVALAGVGNIKGWLEHNLGISLNFKTNKEFENLKNAERVYLINKEKIILENQDKKREDIKNALMEKNLYFIKEETSNEKINKMIEHKIFLLQNVLKFISPNIKLHIEIIPEKQKIDYDKFQKSTKDSETKDFLLDKTNVDTFLLNNGIEAKYDPAKKEYSILFFEEINKETPIKKEDKDLIEKIRNKYIELTGTDSIGFAFDNDTAALKKCEALDYLGKLLNLKPTFIIPTFNFGINDNNDMLKAYKKLVEEHQNQQSTYIMNSIEQQVLKVGYGLPQDFEKITQKAEEIEKNKKKLEDSKVNNPKP